MATTLRVAFSGISPGSNSSMVDGNAMLKIKNTCPGWFKFLYGRWQRQLVATTPIFLRVQIPLWSMATRV